MSRPIRSIGTHTTDPNRDVRAEAERAVTAFMKRVEVFCERYAQDATHPHDTDWIGAILHDALVMFGAGASGYLRYLQDLAVSTAATTARRPGGSLE